MLGAPRDFCCAGCQAVASTIVAAGFEQYYETRTQSATRPADHAAAAAYDDPRAQAQFTFSRGAHERSATLILDGIRCAACLWLNEQTLRRLPGVLRADVNYTTRRAQVAWDPARIRLSAIIGGDSRDRLRRLSLRSAAPDARSSATRAARRCGACSSPASARCR